MNVTNGSFTMDIPIDSEEVEINIDFIFILDIKMFQV